MKTSAKAAVSVSANTCSSRNPVQPSSPTIDWGKKRHVYVHVYVYIVKTKQESHCMCSEHGDATGLMHYTCSDPHCFIFTITVYAYKPA